MNMIKKAMASRYTPWIVGAVLVTVFAVLPFLNIMIPGVFPGPSYTPGTLQLLALCLIYASLALSYHLIFGTAGLLSFGHALYFAIGAYGLGILLQQTDFGLLPSIGLAIAGAIVIATIVGAVSLRVSGISFAMVTLAFAQAGSVLIRRNPQVTGGEEGLRLNIEYVPSFLVGVMNTRNLYWIALALLVIVFLIVTWFERSRAGHVVVATRENELRVRVIGIRPFVVKHLTFVIGTTIAAIVGMLYLLLQSGAAPRVSSADFTVVILLIVVLGGVGSRWGAVVGAIVYTILDQRLTALAGSEFIQGLPAVLRIPLSEPLFILGTLFILVVMFLPGGIAGVARRVSDRSTARRGGERMEEADL
jgi:branched-chain amino acid transport system permease protein